MKIIFPVIAACVILLPTLVFAGDRHVMSGAEILSTFPAMTMVGNYADGVKFAETYHLGGNISYRDDESTDTGNWFEREGLFCTFYKNADGACYKIVKTGLNCYEMYVGKGQDGEQHEPSLNWNSVGWDEKRPSTCDLSDKTV